MIMRGPQRHTSNVSANNYMEQGAPMLSTDKQLPRIHHKENGYISAQTVIFVDAIKGGNLDKPTLT